MGSPTRPEQARPARDGISSFATKNSVHLGRFRVKNATVRAGKTGLLRFTAVNATVWGRKRDCLGLFLRQLTFCNIKCVLL